MTKDRRKHDLYKTLDIYFNPSVGHEPLLIVDTSAIIDVQKRSRNAGSVSSGKVASDFFCSLDKLADVFITPGVLEEVKEHHDCYRLNGNPEISDDLYKCINRYIPKSKALVDEAQEFYNSRNYSRIVDNLVSVINEINIDINHGKKGKKVEKDIISGVDLELIKYALIFAVKSSILLHNKVREKGDIPDNLEGTSRIAVLSSDCHVYNPINSLMHRTEGLRYRDYLMAFNMRDYRIR